MDTNENKPSEEYIDPAACESEDIASESTVTERETALPGSPKAADCEAARSVRTETEGRSAVVPCVTTVQVREISVEDAPSTT